MPNPKSKMTCPKCGAEMNHHADKLTEPVKPEDMKRVNPALGGVIEEMHWCPGCGAVESRRTE
jgi:ribosomal protein S27AE